MSSSFGSGSGGNGGGGGGSGNGGNNTGGGGGNNSNNNNNNSNTNNSTTTTTKAQRRSSGKPTHSRSYPRGVGLDFRKLAGMTLLSYIDHHGVSVRPEAPPSELAVAVARHFENMDIDEDDCIGGFLERLEHGALTGTSSTITTANSLSTSSSNGNSTTGGGGSGSGSSSNTSNNAAASSSLAGGSGGSGTTGGSGGNSSSSSSSIHHPNYAMSTSYSRRTAYFDGRAPIGTVRKRKRSKMAARPGEQVAAKVTRTDENGSWILASVQRFYTDTETYDVQDEDDTSKLIRLPWNHVMRLSTGTEGIFKKGTDCMAIFPETTSFYRAKVSKSPKWTLLGGSGSGGHQHNDNNVGGGSGSNSGGGGSNSYQQRGGGSSNANTSSSGSNSNSGQGGSSYSAGISSGVGNSNNAGGGGGNNNNNNMTGSSSGGGSIVGGIGPVVSQIIVKFEDDEDPQGCTPHRRVPARYVIPIPSDYFYEEAEDVDLTPPQSSSTTTGAITTTATR